MRAREVIELDVLPPRCAIEVMLHFGERGSAIVEVRATRHRRWWWPVRGEWVVFVTDSLPVSLTWDELGVRA